MSSGLLRVFVELGNLHGPSNYVLYWIQEFVYLFTFFDFHSVVRWNDQILSNYFFLLTNTRSCLLTWIWWSVCISNFKVPETFIRLIFSGGFWFLYISFVSNLLHNSEWNTLPLQSCILFYFFCASLQQSCLVLYSFCANIIIILFLVNFSRQRYLVVFLWSRGDDKVSIFIITILSDLNNSEGGLVSILSLIFNSTSLFTRPLGTVSNSPTTISISSSSLSTGPLRTILNSPTTIGISSSSLFTGRLKTVSISPTIIGITDTFTFNAFVLFSFWF